MSTFEEIQKTGIYNELDIYGAVTDWMEKIINVLGEAERAIKEQTASEPVFTQAETLLGTILNEFIIMKIIGETIEGVIGEAIQKDADDFESRVLYVEKRFYKEIKTLQTLILELNLRIVQPILSRIRERTVEFKRLKEKTEVHQIPSFNQP